MCRQLTQSQQYTGIYSLCRKSSPELDALAKEHPSVVHVVEKIDMMADIPDIDGLVAKLEGNPGPIHLLIHNAGAYGPPENMQTKKGDDPGAMYSTQNLDVIDSQTMQYAFQLNTVAPLLWTKALVPNLERAASHSDPAKVIVISSAMGSIEENTSGGHYAYRAAKACANMVDKGLSVDLKPKNVTVSLGKLMSDVSKESSGEGNR